MLFIAWFSISGHTSETHDCLDRSHLLGRVSRTYAFSLKHTKKVVESYKVSSILSVSSQTLLDLAEGWAFTINSSQLESTVAVYNEGDGYTGLTSLEDIEEWSASTSRGVVYQGNSYWCLTIQESDCDKAINISVVKPDIAYFDGRAACREKLGKLDEALTDAKRMLQLDIHDARVQLILSIMLGDWHGRDIWEPGRSTRFRTSIGRHWNATNVAARLSQGTIPWWR